MDLIKDQAERTPATAEAEDLVTRYMDNHGGPQYGNHLAKTEISQCRKALCDSLQAAG